MRIVLKRYACHSTAHVAVTAALALKERHSIKGDDIESIRVAGSEKLVSHHGIHEPADVAMAQYSAPFNLALTFYRDPRNPDVFSEEAVADPRIRALCRNGMGSRRYSVPSVCTPWASACHGPTS